MVGDFSEVFCVINKKTWCSFDFFWQVVNKDEKRVFPEYFLGHVTLSHSPLLAVSCIDIPHDISMLSGLINFGHGINW